MVDAHQEHMDLIETLGNLEKPSADQDRVIVSWPTSFRPHPRFISGSASSEYFKAKNDKKCIPFQKMECWIILHELRDH
jgi:hypothetical protein